MENDNEIKLPTELEDLVQRALRNVKFTPNRDSQENLLKYQPKEEFKRDWTQYESHTRREKLMFLKILKYAMDYLDLQYEYKGNGRPSAFQKDIVIALCIRLYSNYSSWRCESELVMCQSMGFIENIYKRSTLNKYLQSKEITKILKDLIELIASPLAPVEFHFSQDSSGIGKSYAKREWRTVKETPALWKGFNKLHIISGAKTNIIVAVKVTDSNKNDSPFLREMLEEVKGKFNIREFSADAGYLSKENVKAISRAGALPFIKPKKNVSIPSKNTTSAWGQMLKLWKNNQDIFAQYYNQRQNVEATFSMIKRKFGEFSRAKIPTSQENEILAKIVCHNAIILARAMVDFDLDVKFMAS